jgi:hypothetical protein
MGITYKTLLENGKHFDPTQLLNLTPAEYSNLLADIENEDEWFSEWKRLGFLRLDSAKKWKELGFSPFDAQPWYDADLIQAEQASLWHVLKLTPQDYAAWTALGFHNPAEVSAWKMLRVSHVEASVWRSKGFRNPSEVSLVLKMNYKCQELPSGHKKRLSIAELAEWFNRADNYAVTVSERNNWVSQGFTLDEAAEWIVRGITGFNLAELSNLGFSMELIRQTIFTSKQADFSIKLRKLSVQADEIANWTEVAFELGLNATSTYHWSRIGLSPQTAKSWIRHGFTTAEATKPWIDSGMDPITASTWKQSKGIDPSLARQISPILSNPEYESLVEKGIHTREIVEWIHGGWNGDFLQELLSEFSDSQRLIHWRKSSIPLQSWPNWVEISKCQPAVAIAWYQSGISRVKMFELQLELRFEFKDILTWKSQGESAKVATSRIRNGKIRPIRENAAPIKSLKHQIEQPKLEVFPNYHPLSRFSSNEWVEEIQAKAVLLGIKLRKVPNSPIQFYFSDIDIRIEITISNNQVVGTLTSKDTAVTVKFNPLNFEARPQIRTSMQRLAYGLALSLLIDSTIVLAKSSANQTRLFTIQQSQGSNSVKTGIRYLPTLSFRSGLNEVRKGSGAPSALHQVNGHIRTLSDGFQPSEDARNNAPEFIRRRLKPNETYVIPHMRGSGEAVREYEKRLSKYSALAHAIAHLV